MRVHVRERNLVYLQTAVLCANCEVISEGLNGHLRCLRKPGSAAIESPLLGGPIGPGLSLSFSSSAYVIKDAAHLYPESAACTLTLAILVSFGRLPELALIQRQKH